MEHQLHALIAFFAGPVASALCNRFGSRRIAMIGCLISSLALLFSPLSKKDSVFIVLFGLCGGKNQEDGFHISKDVVFRTKTMHI